MILIGILLYCRSITNKERLKQRDNLKNTSFIIDEIHKIRYKEIPELYIDYLKKNKDFEISEKKLKTIIKSCNETKIPECLNLKEYEILNLNKQKNKIENEINELNSKMNNSNDDNTMNEQLNSSQKKIKESKPKLKLDNEFQKIHDELQIFLIEKKQLEEIQKFLKELDLSQLSTNYHKEKINCDFNKYIEASQEMQNLNNQYDDFKFKEKIKEEIEELIKDKLKKRQLLISIQILRQYEDEINKFLSKKHHQKDFINYQLAHNEIKFYLDMAIENSIDVKETSIEKIYYKFLKIFLDGGSQNNEFPIEKIIYFVEEIAAVNLSKHAKALANSDDNKNITSYIEDKMVLNISSDKEKKFYVFSQDKLFIKTLDANDESNQLYIPLSKTKREFTEFFEHRCPTEILTWIEFQQKFLSTEKQFNKFFEKFTNKIYPNTLFRFLSIGCDKLPYEDVNQFLNQVFDIGWQSR